MTERKKQAGPPAGETPPEAPAVATTEGQKGLKVAGREFKDEKELNEFVSSLESSLGRQGKKVGDLEAEVESLKKASPPNPDDAAFYETVETMIYSEPKKAIRMIEDRVNRRLEESLEGIRNDTVSQWRTEQFWSDFAERYPGLAGMVDDIRIVTSVKLWPEVKDLDREARMKYIAGHFTKGFEASKDFMDSRELPPTRPVIESGGGPTGIGVRTVEAGKDRSETFLDELRAASYHKSVLPES